MELCSRRGDSWWKFYRPAFFLCCSIGSATSCSTVCYLKSSIGCRIKKVPCGLARRRIEYKYESMCMHTIRTTGGASVSGLFFAFFRPNSCAGVGRFQESHPFYRPFSEKIAYFFPVESISVGWAGAHEGESHAYCPKSKGKSPRVHSVRCLLIF